MNKIFTSGLTSIFFLLLIQGFPIFADVRASTLAEVKSEKLGTNQNSVNLKAGEDIPFYEGSNENHISVAEGGAVSHMKLHDSATASIEGGSVSHINMYDSSAIKVSGSADISHLTLNNSSQAQISGGTFSFINLADNSEAHIRSLKIDGGSLQAPGFKVFGGAITLERGTNLHIYGREINFADGKLSGIWADGTSFKFWLVERFRGDRQQRYKLPDSMPNQVVFHET